MHTIYAFWPTIKHDDYLSIYLKELITFERREQSLVAVLLTIACRVHAASFRGPSSGRGGHFAERGRGSRGGKSEGGRGGRGMRFEGGEVDFGEGGRGRIRSEHRGRGSRESGRGIGGGRVAAETPPGLGISSAAPPPAIKDAPKQSTDTNIYALLHNSDE